MPIRDFVEEFSQEMELSTPPIWESDKKCHFFLFPDLQIFLEEANTKLKIFAIITNAPSHKKEDVFMRLMEANLLGQGTGGGIISLDPQEKFLTLTFDLPYAQTYQTFRNSLEDFANYLFYWREEIENMQKPPVLG